MAALSSRNGSNLVLKRLFVLGVYNKGALILNLKLNAGLESQVARKAGREAASRIQDVLDRVLDAGRGKPADDVKGLLAEEWRAVFGVGITDSEFFSLAAAELAAGRRVTTVLKGASA